MLRKGRGQLRKMLENRDHGRTQSSRPGTTHTLAVHSKHTKRAVELKFILRSQRDRRGLSFGNCIKGRRVCRRVVARVWQHRQPRPSPDGKVCTQKRLVENR